MRERLLRCRLRTIQYTYSSTQNNGKITSETDVISGEQISLHLRFPEPPGERDQLRESRLGTELCLRWVRKLDQPDRHQGHGSRLSVTYDPATNRQTGESADANGNICSTAGYWTCTNYTYDVENRITYFSGSSVLYRSSLLLCARQQARVARRLDL